MVSSIPNIFLWIKDSGSFSQKKWVLGIKELKNYVKNALHFPAMNYCHFLKACNIDFYRNLEIQCAHE
jgi:hypothetical protein